MLKALNDIPAYLNQSDAKLRQKQLEQNFFDTVVKVFPNLKEISLLALLTPEFQKRLFDYVEDSQQRSRFTLDKREACLKTVARHAIKDGVLTNIRVFPTTKREQEIINIPSGNYTGQMRRLLSLYISKGEAMSGLTDAAEDQMRKAQLSHERDLTAYALLSILLSGIGLEALANLKTSDFDAATGTLALSEDVKLGLPESISAIISDLADSKRTYLFGIFRAADSAKRRSEKIDLVCREVQALLVKNKISIPVTEDPLLTYASLAQECPKCDVEDIRAVISNAIWGGELVNNQSLSAISTNLLRGVASQYTDVVKSWFCIMCTAAPSRAYVRLRIKDSDHCPADIEFLEPTDTLYRHDGKRTIPYENPFFQSMLLIKCNFFEAKIIDLVIGYCGYLYGFTDAEGTFHCRISQEEIDRLTTYLKINGRRKTEISPDAILTGSKVILTHNQFKGLIGTVVAYDDKAQKMDVAVEIFCGQPAVIKGVPSKHIQPLNPSRP